MEGALLCGSNTGMTLASAWLGAGLLSFALRVRSILFSRFSSRFKRTFAFASDELDELEVELPEPEVLELELASRRCFLGARRLAPRRPIVSFFAYFATTLTIAQYVPMCNVSLLATQVSPQVIPLLIL